MVVMEMETGFGSSPKGGGDRTLTTAEVTEADASSVVQRDGSGWWWRGNRAQKAETAVVATEGATIEVVMLETEDTPPRWARSVIPTW